MTGRAKCAFHIVCTAAFPMQLQLTCCSGRRVRRWLQRVSATFSPHLVFICHSTRELLTLPIYLSFIFSTFSPHLVFICRRTRELERAFNSSIYDGKPLPSPPLYNHFFVFYLIFFQTGQKNVIHGDAPVFYKCFCFVLIDSYAISQCPPC